MRVLAVVLLPVLLWAGCVWRSYDRVLEIHLEVLQSMAVKMCGMSGGPPPPSESLGEFVYPGKRAREMQEQYSSRADLASYQGFGKVIEQYEGLVQLFDRSRATPETWEAASPRVCDQSRALAAQVAEVRRALAREG